MSIQTLSTLFVGIISLWAMWCMLSARVHDGIVGKIIYATIMLTGFAIVTRAETVFVSPTTAGVTFHGALALAGLRHWFVANHWPIVKGWLCRYLHCEQCLNSVETPTRREND
jgi:thiosulfate reductase cytochrome b subunit